MERNNQNELDELVAWFLENGNIPEVRQHQILTYGTDSDKVLLELFTRFGRFVRNVRP